MKCLLNLGLWRQGFCRFGEFSALLLGLRQWASGSVAAVERKQRDVGEAPSCAAINVCCGDCMGKVYGIVEEPFV